MLLHSVPMLFILVNFLLRSFQLKTIADNKITFKCNYLGTFSCNVFYIPPQTINFEKIIMNFNEKLAGSPYVLVTNITLLIIAVISVLVLRRFDIIDQKRVGIYVLFIWFYLQSLYWYSIYVCQYLKPMEMERSRLQILI